MPGGFRLVSRAALLLLAWAGIAAAAPVEPPMPFSGGPFTYTVVPGDTLGKIGARFGVSVSTLARENGIANPDRIFPGQSVHGDNRHIVPVAMPDGIIINIPQRMLFFFKGGRLTGAEPVGLGKPDWPTVQGDFAVKRLIRNPVWQVPKSIQEEMESEGRFVETRVPPGPENPLGQFWIGLTAPGYGIHGTIAPESVYHFQSHGCIRLDPAAIAHLFAQVTVGLPVRIIYRPVLLVQADGRVFAEIHPDAYAAAPPPLDTLRRLAEEQGITGQIDWPRLQTLARKPDGAVHDVTGVVVR